jgi:arylsulfatase A-like enzyme
MAPPPARPAEPGPDGYNPKAMTVIVFALSDCPVAALGPYGNEWIGTPHLDRLAAEGIVFDFHVSDCPDPAAARRAWRTGRHQFPAPTPPTPDLLTRLTAAGVRTVLVRHGRESSSGYPDFYVGWSERFDARPDPADPAPADALLRTLPTVLDRLAGSERWLLWIEIDRLTPPWFIPSGVFAAYVEDLLEDDDPEHEAIEETTEDEEVESENGNDVEPDAGIEPWADPQTGWFDVDDSASWELLHRSFAAAVTALDADLGRVFDLLRARGLDRAAWVLTADRGQPLGEHGLIGPHRPWLHEELVHVPLIIRLPGAGESGRRVAALTQPADLMPTLAAWFGVDGPGTDDGFDLTPLIQGRAAAVREFARTGLAIGPAVELAIRTPQWAYLLPVHPHPDDDARQPVLFAKPDDRWEVNDLRPRNLETADDLDRQLREVLAIPGEASPRS